MNLNVVPTRENVRILKLVPGIALCQWMEACFNVYHLRLKDSLPNSTMFRQPRIDVPDVLHCIIYRGIERRRIFTDYGDRDNFFNRLSPILKEIYTTWLCLANHFH